MNRTAGKPTTHQAATRVPYVGAQFNRAAGAKNVRFPVRHHRSAKQKRVTLAQFGQGEQLAHAAATG